MKRTKDAQKNGERSIVAQHPYRTHRLLHAIILKTRIALRHCASSNQDQFRNFLTARRIWRSRPPHLATSTVSISYATKSPNDVITLDGFLDIYDYCELLPRERVRHGKPNDYGVVSYGRPLPERTVRR